jgi:hypothetical protein
MPMLFSPTIGAAVTARAIDSCGCAARRAGPSMQLTFGRWTVIPTGGKQSHSRTVVPTLRPNAPFAELVKLSRTSIADEMREDQRRQVLGE